MRSPRDPLREDLVQSYAFFCKCEHVSMVKFIISDWISTIIVV